MTPSRFTSRQVGLLVAATAGACLVLLALVLVPWDPTPGEQLRPVSPRSLFTDAEIRRAESFSGRARLLSWSSLGSHSSSTSPWRSRVRGPR